MKIFALLMTLFCLNSFAQDSASLFEIETKWKDQEGKTFQLKDLKGSKTIVAMAYTSCAHACPMTISKIHEIEKKINKGTNYKVVLASFDVKRDTPPVMKKQMGIRKLDPKIWTLLSANDDQAARELSLVLGISYKDLGNGDFSHSNSITLLDENGVKQAQLEGLNSEPTEFINKINGKK